MKSNIKTYTIPMDILLDVVKILLHYKIRNYIDSIKEEDNSLVLGIEILPDKPIHKKAMENIEDILGEYDYCVNGKPNIKWNY